MRCQNIHKWIIALAAFLLAACPATAQVSIFIPAGDTLAVDGNSSIIVDGNWENNGVFAPGAGTVILNGNQDQTVISGGSSYHHLVIDKSGGVLRLGGDLLVQDSLRMNGGNIETTGNTLMHGVNQEGVLVHTTGVIIGQYARYLDAVSGARLFPVGNDTAYRPLTIDYTIAPSSAGTITVAHEDPGGNFALFDPALSDAGYIIDRRSQMFWSAAATGITGGSYNLSIDGSGQAGIDDPANLRIVHSVGGSSFDLLGNHNPGSGSIAGRSGIDGNSHGLFYLGGNGADNPFGGGSAIGPAIILATNSIKINNGADILSGNVIVNDSSSGPLLGDDAQLVIDKNVSSAAGYSLKAHRIKVKKNAMVNSDIFYNELQNSGTLSGSQHTPLFLPVLVTLPPFISGASGTAAVMVAENDSLTLEPGNYGEVLVAEGGILVLQGGIYNLAGLSMEEDCRLYFADFSEVRILGRFFSGKNSRVMPDNGSGLSASDMILYVAGANSSCGLEADTLAAEIGGNNLVMANFYAPNGTIKIGKDGNANGAFIGRDVLVGKNTQLTLNSYFDDSANKMLVTRDDLPLEEFTRTSAGEGLPKKFALSQNYPNPFNPNTVIRYSLPVNSKTNLEIYDILGRKVRTLVNEGQNAGYYRIVWDGRNGYGQAVASGIYIYRIQAGDFVKVRKMMLVK